MSLYFLFSFFRKAEKNHLERTCQTGPLAHCAGYCDNLKHPAKMLVVLRIFSGGGFEPLNKDVSEKRELIGILDMVDQRGECAANKCVSCFWVFRR